MEADFVGFFCQGKKTQSGLIGEKKAIAQKIGDTGGNITVTAQDS